MINPLSNPAYLLPPLFALFACLILLAVVLYGSQKSFSSLLFRWLLLSVGLWGLLLFGMRSSPDIDRALLWERALPVTTYTTFLLFYHFTLAYTNNRGQRGILLTAYLFLAVVAALSPTKLLVEEMRLEDYGYAPVVSPAVGLIMMSIPLLMVGGVYNLVRRYKVSPSYEERNRLLYLIIAPLFTLLGLFLDVFSNLPPAAIWSNLMFCIICTVAILKYHMLDIRVAVRKSLVYLLISTAVATPYVGILLALNRVFGAEADRWWVHAVIILSLAVILRPLYSWVQQFVDRLFYRDRYDYLRALQRFSQEAQSIVNLQELGSNMAQLVAGALRTSSIYLLLPSEDKGGLVVTSSASLEKSPFGVVLRNSSPLIKWLELKGDILSSKQLDIIPQLQSLSRKEKNELERMGAEIYVPLKTHQSQLSGILVLGQKLSQESYSGEDKQLLMALSSQMAIALDNARLYEETRLSEKALRESEKKYRELADSLPQTVFEIDGSGNFTFANRRGFEVFGYTIEDFNKGLNVLQMLIPEDHDRARKNIQRVLSGEKLDGNEYTALRKDGSTFPIVIYSTPIIHENKPVGLRGIVIDITERKQAEAELTQSREHLRDLSIHLQSAREAERAGIARELHDELGQALTALKMDLSWLGKRLHKDQESLHEKIKSMSRLTDVTIQTVKRISAELRPGLLDDLGLMAAIEWQTAEFQNRTGIKCQLSLGSGDIVVDRECTTTVFRIFQETLTNVTRHAHATRVKVSLREKAGRLVLKVRDNGKGITQEQTSSHKSFGLIGIRERARSQGGEVEISGIRDKGTTVTLNIPIDRKGKTR